MKINSTIQDTQKLYAQLSSAKRINSAADDAAGLSIATKMNAQVNGYTKGAENAQAAVDLANTADGALDSIQGSLQRMKELAVQASNGTLVPNDLKSIQQEIGQLKEGIQQTARNTEFNTIKLLDGTFENRNIASGPSGTGTPMTIKNTSLEALGIDQFDVTKAFNIEDIDNALQKVSESRSSIGAQTNGFKAQINNNEVAALNLAGAQDKIISADIEKTVMDIKKNQVLQQVQTYTQQQQSNMAQSTLNLLK